MIKISFRVGDYINIVNEEDDDIDNPNQMRFQKQLPVSTVATQKQLPISMPNKQNSYLFQI